MKRSVLVLLLLWFGFGSLSFAQQALWQNFGADHDLPDPNVTALFKADNGLLYVGTAIGLYSYDGYDFRKIDFRSVKKINPYINCLVIKGECIYIGARDALICYNYRTNCSQVIHTPLNSIGGVMGLYVENQSNILYARTHGGALMIDIKSGNFRAVDSLLNPMIWKIRVKHGKKIQAFLYSRKFVEIVNHREELLFNDKGILDTEWWEKEHCWLIVKKEGLFTLDTTYSLLHKLDINFPLNTTENKWLYPDSGGNIWIQAAGGFLCLHSREEKTPEFFNNEPGNPFTINSNTAQAFYTGPDGTNWVGGDGTGLGCLTPIAGGIKFLSNEQAGVQHFWCFLYEKETNKLLCGTTSGVLEGTFINGELRNRKLYKPTGFDRFSVNAFVDLNESEYLISVFKAGFWTFNKQTKQFKQLTEINKQVGSLFVFATREVSGNRCVLCTQNGAYLMDKKSMKIAPFGGHDLHKYSIYTAIENGADQFLMSGGFGLQVFNSELRQICYFSKIEDSVSSLPSNVIFDLADLGRGKYMLATMGGGLCVFDENSKTFSPIKLVTNPDNIFGIMYTGTSKVILTTSNGLCQYDLRTGKSVILNKSNLLPFNDFNQSAFYRDATYTLVGGEKGMLILNSEKSSEIFGCATELLIWNDTVQVNEVTLPPGDHSLRLKVSLANLYPGAKLRYKYFIDNLDDEVHFTAAGQNELNYNYMPPGNYSLEIELVDETGFITAGKKSIRIHVMPFFYQTTWFKVFIVVILLIIIILSVRYFAFLRLRWKLNRLDAERKVMLERSRISRELHDNLGSQLTYMITGLETTDLLLKRNKIDKTAHNLEKLQSAARESMQQLRDSIWALNPGAMTLSSLLGQYEKWLAKITEPNEHLSAKMTSSQCPDFDIDPINGLNIFRIMQEAVHNVLKHAGATELTTSVECNQNMYTITIADNGKGIISYNESGTGLGSMKQRAENLKAILTVDSTPGSGTKVVLVLDKNTLKG